MMNETTESSASNFNHQQGAGPADESTDLPNYNTSVVDPNHQSFLPTHMSGVDNTNSYSNQLGATKPMYGNNDNPVEISTNTDILAETASEQDSSMMSGGIMGGVPGNNDYGNRDVEGGGSILSAPQPFNSSQIGYNDNNEENNVSYNNTNNNNTNDDSTMDSDNFMDPRKVPSNDTTLDMVHSPSGEGLTPEDLAAASTSAAEMARREKRKRTFRCYLLTAVIVMILAIGIPLGAVMIFSGNNNNNNETDASTSDSSQQASTADGEEVVVEPGEIVEDPFDDVGTANSTVYVNPPLAQDVLELSHENSEIAEAFSELGDVQNNLHSSGIPAENEVVSEEPPAVEENASEGMDTTMTDTLSVGMVDTAVSSNPPDTVVEETSTESQVAEILDLPAPVEEPVEVVLVDMGPSPLVDETVIPDNDFIYPTLLSLTPEADLMSGTTPQGRAYRWLDSLDQLALTDLAFLPQRYAMVALDFGVHGMNHANFVNPDLHECDWEGVTCNNRLSVTGIKWNAFNLTGSLVPELRYLDTLSSLDLAENELTGTLDYVWYLPNLQSIYLHHNRFSGIISPMIGQMTSIEHLYLSHNELTGSIPYNIASSGGQGKPLRYLVLSHNQFTGPLPYNFRLRSLFYLDMGYNQLSGPIPQDWDRNMISLRHLWLDHNRLTGVVPDNFANLGRGRLRQMYINDNSLTGELPGGWTGFGFLSNVNFAGNNLSGRIDRSLCELNVYDGGEMIELRAPCDICDCDYLCESQCTA